MKKCNVRFSLIKKNKAFQKNCMKVEVKKQLRARMMPARTWRVHAVEMSPTEMLKLRRQMAAAAGKKSTLHHGYSVLGRRSMDWKTELRAKRSLDKAAQRRPDGGVPTFLGTARSTISGALFAGKLAWRLSFKVAWIPTASDERSSNNFTLRRATQPHASVCQQPRTEHASGSKRAPAHGSEHFVLHCTDNAEAKTKCVEHIWAPKSPNRKRTDAVQRPLGGLQAPDFQEVVAHFGSCLTVLLFVQPRADAVKSISVAGFRDRKRVHVVSQPKTLVVGRRALCNVH